MKYCVFDNDGNITKTGFAPPEMHSAIVASEINVVFFEEGQVSDLTHYVETGTVTICAFTVAEMQAKSFMPYGWTWCMPDRVARDLRSVDQKEVDDVLVVQKTRAKSYPPLTDFADAMYWQSKGDFSKMEAYLAACDAVKAQNPKPQS